MSSVISFDVERGVVAIAPIGELAELERVASEELLNSMEGCALSRRRERLASRLLLGEVAPAASIEYLSNGKPLVKNSHYRHISISHCRDYVAVMLSALPCGVDIERVDRDFSRVASRYMTQQEQSLCLASDWAAMVWCAKEALFKIEGREGVDFRRDIMIDSVVAKDDAKYPSWQLESTLFGGQKVSLQCLRFDDKHLLVFTL